MNDLNLLLVQPKHSFYTTGYRGWFIHGHVDRVLARSVIAIQTPDYRVVRTNCRTLEGAKKRIRKEINKHAST